MTGERLTFGRPQAVVSRPAAPALAAGEPRPVRLSRVETWDWGWGGLLIFTFLLFFRPQDQIPGLRNLPVNDIAALIGLGAMVSINLSRRLPLTRITPELLGMFALGGVVLATVPTSFWGAGALNQFIAMVVPLVLIFMLMVNTVTSPKRIERLSWIIVLAFGYMCTLTIFNYMRGVGLVGGRASGPVGGFFQNPNDLALNLAAFLPLAAIFVKRPGPFWKRVVAAGVCALMLIVVVLTRSRGSTLGVAAMMLTFLFVARLMTPGTIIALVIAGMATVPLMPDSFWNRMASITDPSRDETGSRRERQMLLGQALTVFLEHPLTGVGIGQFTNYYRPGLATRWHEAHNVFLQVGAEIGVFGLAAFVFLVVRAFGAAWWTRRHLAWIYRKRTRKKAAPEPEDGLTAAERLFLQTHAAAMVAGLVGWLVAALFLSVAFNWTFYYLLGLSVAARDVVRAREQAYARAKAVAAREVSAA